MTTPDPTPLFALDFETTGLDPRLDQILEVGLAGPRPFHALVADATPSSPGAQLEMGNKFKHDWNVRPPQSCSGCHR